MLFGKKKKIASYLEDKKTEPTAFDLVLKDYLSGVLITKLKKIGLTAIEVHIDWYDKIKDLGIQAKYNGFFLDIQIDEQELALGCSNFEPDCDEYITLDGKNSADILYNAIQSRISKIN